MSRLEENVIKKIKARAELGNNKYGTSMERADLSALEWLKHAQEEAMDLAVYLEKVMEVVREDYEELLLQLFEEPDTTADDVVSDFSSDPLHDPFDTVEYHRKKTNWEDKLAIQKYQQSLG